MYLTYDIKQASTDPTEEQPVLRGAKEFSIPGKMVDWEVGEFELESGSKSYGVRVNYVDDANHLSSTVIDVPSLANNVLVHTRDLPKEYRAALNSAA